MKSEMIKIGDIYVRWDSIKLIFDTFDEIQRAHACFSLGDGQYHKCYGVTAKEIYELIEKTAKEQ